MKKYVLLIALVPLVLGGCSLSTAKAGLEISTYPQSKVFLDSEEVGTTPLKMTDLKPGEVDIKLQPEDVTIAEWTRKLILNKGTTTILNHEFSSVLDKDSSQILYFEKSGKKDEASLLVTSQPDGASVSLGGEMKGFTPLTLENVSDQDVQLLLSFPGYQAEEILARPVKGYRLIAELKLAHEELPTLSEPGTGTATTSATPTENSVEILDTPTGWLRVRNAPSLTASESGKVNPKETFPLLAEESGWFQIKLEDGTSGWISSRYAKKLTD